MGLIGSLSLNHLMARATDCSQIANGARGLWKKTDAAENGLCLEACVLLR